MRSFEEGGRAADQSGAPASRVAGDRILDEVENRLSGMLAHCAMRDVTKDIAKDLLFAECYAETERLRLRPLKVQDLPAYAAMLGDPDSFTYAARGPMSGEEAFTRLCRQAGHWTLFDHGLFGVFEKESERFVGEVGFCHFNRDLGPDHDEFPEASWTISKAYQGRGYAQEAARAALDFTRDRLLATKAVAMVHHENLCSLHIARKLGFRAVDERIYRGFRAIMFERRF